MGKRNVDQERKFISFHFCIGNYMHFIAHVLRRVCFMTSITLRNGGMQAPSRQNVKYFFIQGKVLCLTSCVQGATLVTISRMNIALTSPFNLDPLEPHFYIVKLGFAVVYIISSFYAFLLIYDEQFV